MEESAALQLIDQHKHFSSEALTIVLKPLGQQGKDYFTVAIIGSQSTGKSTLLNYLFGTKFKVLEGLAGTRTTRGIVLGHDHTYPLVVLDVEGNDSYENHLQGDENYQKMVSSFALVASNLLIVNIQEKQLGQHTGSQYQTLSIVLRICIDQFKQESPKTVLFCLRDANPNYTDEGQCRRKLQNDMLKIWKSVWAGTKKAEDFQKYADSPERFFTLEVAFLREFDKDYPQDFIEDVSKLRQRFVNPESEGYLFKKQKKELNVPASDLPLLLQNIWTTLTTNKELNLPNEKIQLANYRCEQLFFEMEKKYEGLLQEYSGKIINYGQLLSDLKTQFNEKSSRYPKAVSEPREKDLVDNFKTKINKIILLLLDNSQESLIESFSKTINENIFYDPQGVTFKEQSKKLYDQVVQEYLRILKALNYEIDNRKERIEGFEKKLEQHIEEESREKIKHIEEEFEKEGQRKMSMLAGKILKEHFGLEFWHYAYQQYRKTTDQLLKEETNRYNWGRGTAFTSNQLDAHEEKLYNWLVQELKNEFEKNLAERLLGYFNQHFKSDQYGASYNFNAMEQKKISEIYMQAKEMSITLLKAINNFEFKLTKRSSFICADDIAGDEVKPFLETSKMLLVKESFEHKTNDEFYTAIRRKKESQGKRIPWYLVLLIVYFIYDDLPSPTENALLFKLIGIVLVIVALPFALGQGHVIHQLLNSIFEGISKKAGSLWPKRQTK